MNDSTLTPARPPAVAVVYESLFGSTRSVAESLTEGIREQLLATVTPISLASPSADCDILVVGAPTHAHSLSTPASRAEAERWARDRARHLTLDDSPHTTGMREWLERRPTARLGYVAFDTRVDMPRIFTGSAATAIGRRLKKHGLREILAPESFLVDSHSRLLSTERDRAVRWGREIAEAALALTDETARIPR